MTIEITLQDADLGNIVVAANRALEVAHREYMRLRGGLSHITLEAIAAEQERIMTALQAGESIPDGDEALQIAALYEQTVGTVVMLVKEIQGARGTGAIVANLYLLLAQQTGFLMALDAQSRGEPYPDQLASYRKGRRPGAPNKSTEAIRAEIRRLLKDPALKTYRQMYAAANREIVGDMALATFEDHVRDIKRTLN